MNEVVLLLILPIVYGNTKPTGSGSSSWASNLEIVFSCLGAVFICIVMTLLGVLLYKCFP